MSENPASLSSSQLHALRLLGTCLVANAIETFHDVSHACIHVVEFGTPVAIADLKIKSGDLLHGGQQGFQTIPRGRAGDTAATAARIKAREEAMVEFCHSAKFSLEKLRAKVASTPRK